jgi:hypothetical protein
MMVDLGGKAQLGHGGGHILMDARRAVELYVVVVFIQLILIFAAIRKNTEKEPSAPLYTATDRQRQ